MSLIERLTTLVMLHRRTCSNWRIKLIRCLILRISSPTLIHCSPPFPRRALPIQARLRNRIEQMMLKVGFLFLNEGNAAKSGIEKASGPGTHQHEEVRPKPRSPAIKKPLRKPLPLQIMIDLSPKSFMPSINTNKRQEYVKPPSQPEIQCRRKLVR